jgi:hypothetical protein
VPARCILTDAVAAARLCEHGALVHVIAASRSLPSRTAVAREPDRDYWSTVVDVALGACAEQLLAA